MCLTVKHTLRKIGYNKRQFQKCFGLCIFRKYFCCYLKTHELRQNVLNERLIFPLYKIQKIKNWRRHNMPSFVKVLNKINRNTYHDYCFIIESF